MVRPDRVDHEFTIFDNRILIDFDVDEQKDYRLEKIVLEPSQVKRRHEEFEQLVVRYGKTVKDFISSTPITG
jgi:hypothetical protein